MGKIGLYFLVIVMSVFGIGFADEYGVKKIALSFDDAPRGAGPMFLGPERTEQFLKSLEAANIPPVVIFATTRGIEDPEGLARLRQYDAAGHLIANHTHTHQWLHRTPLDEYLADLDEAEGLLTGFTHKRPWFRFPYLDEARDREKRDAMRVALKERGLINGYVTVDNYDWYIERLWLEAVQAGKDVDLEALKKSYIDMLLGAVAFYDAVAVEHLERRPVHLLLLHENDLAALFVDELVEALRQEGWEIVSPDEVYADPIATVEPRTLITGQGRVAALAVDAGADPRKFDHLAIDEGKLRAFLEERSVFRSEP